MELSLIIPLAQPLFNVARGHREFCAKCDSCIFWDVWQQFVAVKSQCLLKRNRRRNRSGCRQLRVQDHTLSLREDLKKTICTLSDCSSLINKVRCSVLGELLVACYRILVSGSETGAQLWCWSVAMTRL